MHITKIYTSTPLPPEVHFRSFYISLPMHVASSQRPQCDHDAITMMLFMSTQGFLCHHAYSYSGHYSLFPSEHKFSFTRLGH